jgi:hypothetical protein
VSLWFDSSAAGPAEQETTKKSARADIRNLRVGNRRNARILSGTELKLEIDL